MIFRTGKISSPSDEADPLVFSIFPRYDPLSKSMACTAAKQYPGDVIFNGQKELRKNAVGQ